MNKILIIGANGQIGWELQRNLSTVGQIMVFSRNEINLADPDTFVPLIRREKPDIIANAGAYTAVDLAEKEKETASIINGTAPGILAEEAKRIKAKLIHYSTDYVFDGQSNRPYLEEDHPDPQNFYGKSKLAGEQAIAAIGGEYYILRTSWVYGNRGKNFLLTMLKLAQERNQLRIVNDQIGAPTWSRLVAQGTVQLILRTMSCEPSFPGIYHLTCSGQTSWYGFAEAIFKRAAACYGLPIPQIVGIPTHEYPLPASRPHYSVLSNEKIIRTFSISMPSWEIALSLCLSN